MRASQPALRKIIHIDMDAFYASVEVRDCPDLLGRPVVVGGSPQSRGVVAAASYEARRYGIRSAMPCARAYRLCPDAVFIRPDFAKYRAVSAQIHDVFARYTPLVEPLSLDEAYLDVTDSAGDLTATEIARRIRAEIRAETRLTASAGVAPNKFLAKIASEERKPDGLFVITPARVAAFVKTLPLEKVPGIGRATLERFHELGVRTCGELQRLSLAELGYRFGKRGEWFYRIARGIDERPVEAERERKSVSIEDTFSEDHGEPAWLLAHLAGLCRQLGDRLAQAGVKGRTVTVKLRLADFRTLTRSHTLDHYTADPDEIHAEAERLFRDSGVFGDKLRLLGVGLSHLDNVPEAPGAALQLSLPLEPRAGRG